MPAITACSSPIAARSNSPRSIAIPRSRRAARGARGALRRTLRGYVRWKDGRYLQETYANKVHAGVVAGKPMSAVQITTAAGITAVLDLLTRGELKTSGFVRQEEIPLEAFLANRFGRF